MEPNKIDSKIKNLISVNQDFYDVNAIDSKERIWSSIEQKTRKRRVNLLIYPLAAACVILIFISSFLTISLVDYKKNLTELSKQRKIASNKNLRKSHLTNQLETLFDTVYVTNEKIIIQEKIINNPIEVITYITDTIYIEKPIYQEPEIQDNLNIVESSTEIDNHEKNTPTKSSQEILITNNNDNNKGRKKNISFRFGGHNSESYSSGPLTLSSIF